MSLPAMPVSALDGLLSIKFFIFLSPFWMGLTNPRGALRQFLLRLTSPKLSTLSGIPPFFTDLFWPASLLALLAGLNLFFLIDALAWFFKLTKVAFFESVKEFCKNQFLALYFSFFINDLPAFLLFSVSCSLYDDDPSIWSPFYRSLLWWRLHKELSFDCSAGLSTGVFLSVQANMKLSSQWISIKQISSVTSFN